MHGRGEFGVVRPAAPASLLPFSDFGVLGGARFIPSSSDRPGLELVVQCQHGVIALHPVEVHFVEFILLPVSFSPEHDDIQ